MPTIKTRKRANGTTRYAGMQHKFDRALEQRGLRELLPFGRCAERRRQAFQGKNTQYPDLIFAGRIPFRVI